MLYQELITELVKQFEKISFHHLLREDNQIVDALATLATMFKVNMDTEVQPIKISILESLAHCVFVEEEIDGKPWYYDIYHTPKLWVP